MKCIVTYWERDTLATFETGRARLLDLLEAVSKTMREDGKPLLMTGGETALLGDVAGLRPDLQALLVVYNAAGRLALGPWYMQPETMLVSGESLVRNLLAARANAERYYGITLAQVAYMPLSAGYPAQLPQILRGFGIDTALIARGTAKALFRWRAPDGSQVLAVKLAPGQPFTFKDHTLLLLPFGQDHEGEVTSLDNFIDRLRPAAPETIAGELYTQTGQPDDYLWPGVLSNRLYLKQDNARLQAQLTYAAEPWLALAQTHGKLRAPANLRALLVHGWRLLLNNQRMLGGTGSDATHIEDEARFKQVEDVSQHIIRDSLAALPGKPGQPATDQTHIVVWNPHNWQAQQMVAVAVTVPAGHYPARLVDTEGREIPFAWSAGIMRFAADAPPVGYTTYTLHLADEVTNAEPTRSTGVSITSTLGDDKLEIAGDRIVWRHVEPALIKAGQVVRENVAIDQTADLLQFFDGGDAGDAFNYSPPVPDQIARASLLTNFEVERSPIYQRLIFQHRFRVAPTLNDQRGRTRGVKSLDVKTTATLYHHLPGIHFHTTIDNTVNDHRLRAHLSTGLRSGAVLAGSAFGLARRDIPGGKTSLPDAPHHEAIVATRPMHNLCAVDNGTETVALLTRGLPEYEAISENGQITLALTLLRAVGWRSRDDLRTRTAAIGPVLATPDAQMQRPLTADYALMMLPTKDPAALLRAGQLYSAPLQAYQYAERPPQSKHSYLTVEGDHLLLTALKPPEQGSGWVLHLLNPTDKTVTSQLQPALGLKAAQVVNLAEEPQRNLDISEQRRIPVTVAPHQILALHLKF